MPAVDTMVLVEADRDREKERERDKDLERQDRADKSSSKQKLTQASTKAKDLSHVPCKFFKVGACTAGSSCPFSHTAAEPGAQKEPCAWFVKGNCKFGHKCALAHILPGQTMSMDRKNKKAAQQAAAASGGSEKGGKEARKKREGQSSSPNNAPGRNNTLLVGGSTAPTRLLSSTSTAPASNRPPMPLKASLSPSAPAPPLKDTEFASFAALDEMEGVQLPAPPAHGKSQGSEAIASSDSTNDGDGQSQSTPSPVPLPTSAPRVTTAMTPSDFGPIGSPPNASRGQQSVAAINNGTYTPGTSPRGPSQINGVNLGKSPQTGPGFLSSSPFSAPGTQSVFIGSSYTGHGVAASLGSGLTMMGGRRVWGDADVSSSPAKGGHSMLASSMQRSSLLNGNARGEYGIELEYEDYEHGKKRDSAVEDGDMEDFIPGSLTDLLTPEERSRRMSRSGSNPKPHHPATPGAPFNSASGELTAPAPSGTRLGHRYSSSVPAPSLLGDIKSIWSDTSVGPLPGSPSAQPTHKATPSASFATRFEGLSVNGQQGGSDDMGLSMSMGSTGAASSLGMMSPSNASAAFLPGLHHNYLKNKASQQAQLGLSGPNTGGLSRGLRGTSGPIFPPGNNTGNLSTNYMSGMGSNHGYPSSANPAPGLPQLPSYRGAPSPFDLTQPMHQAHNQHPRPIPTADSKRLGVGLGFGGTSVLGVGGNANVQGTNGGVGASGPGTGTGLGGLEGEIMTGQFLSPNSRALHSHAPGQSLPQGLAAGYSRIHALPPLSNLTSPGLGTGAAFPSSVADAGIGIGSTMVPGGTAPGVNSVANSAMAAPARDEWGASSLPPQTLPISGPPPGNGSNSATSGLNHGASANTNSTATNANASLMPGFNNGVQGANPGLDSVLSKLSYSAAAKGGAVSSSPTPPGLMKGAAGRYASGLSTLDSHGLGAQNTFSSSSPLRPRGEDDDELFTMDK